jgi:hypothetical protein
MIAFDVSDFEWSRPASKSGCRWRSSDDPILETRGEMITYRPFEHSGLFRTFADTPETLDGILAFVARFGSLRKQHAGFVEESFAEWAWTIQIFRTGVAVCEHVAEGNRKALAKYIRFQPDHVQFLDPTKTADGDAEAITGIRTEVLVLLGLDPRPGKDLISIALMLASHALRKVGGQMTPDFAWNSVARQIRTRVEVSSLNQMMALQFLSAYGTGKTFAACLVCHRWFELSPGVNRSDRTTCSDSCRVRAYAARRKRARELAAEGKTVRQIAKELGSKDIEKVKGWIERGEGDREK